MQMLAVVSGAEMIQDIPTHYRNLNKEYLYQHRNEKETPESYRDYAPHDVSIAKDSLAYKIYQKDLLTGCPSWHHQAVLSVENTDFVVSGSIDTNSEEMIEIIEHKDKNFVIGLQFHPEAAVVKNINNAENASDFMNVETAMLVFEALVKQID
jgi:putative glutamine amidotransferase